MAMVGIKSFLQLENELPFDENKLVDNEHFYEFENGFIKSENSSYIKIKGVQVKYDTSIGKRKLEHDIEKNTEAILKNELTGETKFI